LAAALRARVALIMLAKSWLNISGLVMATLFSFFFHLLGTTTSMVLYHERGCNTVHSTMLAVPVFSIQCDEIHIQIDLCFS
jgi:hypothetical protein